MTGAALDQGLLEGRGDATLADYADAWTHDDICIRLTGMGAFMRCPSLLNKIRGAMGQVLLLGASDPVRDRKPCNWSQTCAAEVFFGARPRVRVGDHDSELTKPYVLWARAEGSVLVIGIRVFGRARAWSGAVCEAMAIALRSHVRWDQLARDLRHPAPHRIAITDVGRQGVTGIPVDSGGATTVDLAFATPVSAARGDPSIDRDLIWANLARRLALMAPWHGIAAASIHPALVSSLDGLQVEIGEVPAKNPSRAGKSGYRYLDRSTLPPLLKLSQLNSGGLMALRMGEHTHIGRGAALGLGRFVLNARP